MQQETGCKIAVRGSGAFIDKPIKILQDDDEDEPLHVFITAPNEESLQKASKLIEGLLEEVKSGNTDHKQKQLRDLAIINGTLIEQTRCRICNGIGHPIWNCPERTGEKWTPANVECSICGEMTHVTTDCRHYDKSKPIDQQIKLQNTNTIDEEYSSFMNELMGDAPMSSNRPKAAIALPKNYIPNQSQRVPNASLLNMIPNMRPLVPTMVNGIPSTVPPRPQPSNNSINYHNVPPPHQATTAIQPQTHNNTNKLPNGIKPQQPQPIQQPIRPIQRIPQQPIQPPIQQPFMYPMTHPMMPMMHPMMLQPTMQYPMIQPNPYPYIPMQPNPYAYQAYMHTKKPPPPPPM